MGKYLSRSRMEKDIVSKESLDAVLQITCFLKEDFNLPMIEYQPRNNTIVKKIFNLLKKGQSEKLRTYLDSNNLINVILALFKFLRTLPSPLLPTRIQNLIVADNPGISECRIALDALGLLKQNILHYHRLLLIALFDLLDFYLKHPNCSELEGSGAPVHCLPALFNLKDSNTNWMKLAAILQELVSNRKLLSDDSDQSEQVTQITELRRSTFTYNSNYINGQSAEGFSSLILITPLNNINHGRLHPVFNQ